MCPKGCQVLCRGLPDDLSCICTTGVSWESKQTVGLCSRGSVPGVYSSHSLEGKWLIKDIFINWLILPAEMKVSTGLDYFEQK